MNVVIIGGHDRLVCRYKEVCAQCGCKAKVFTQRSPCLGGSIGCPHLIVVFTGLVSHLAAKTAKELAADKNITLVQSHCASCNALRNILKAIAPGARGRAE